MEDMDSTDQQLWLFQLGLRETMAIVYFSHHDIMPNSYIKAWRILDQ